MRKIVAGLSISLDGVIEDPNEWMGPWFNAEVGQAVGSMIAAQDAMLLGRVTYDAFAAHWPHQTGEMADTVIPRDHAAEQIAELKRQPGKNIGMTGSGTLVSWLLREGLLDELHLLVFPVVLGHGKRLFADPGGKVPLKLTGSAAYETGVLNLTYVRA